MREEQEQRRITRGGNIVSRINRLKTDRKREMEKQGEESQRMGEEKRR